MVGFLLMLGGFIAACWIRFLIWLLAMTCAIIPAVHVAGVHLSPDIDLMADAVNKVGFFHEFYFVVIIASIFGISNILYSSFFLDKRINLTIACAFGTALLFFLYALVDGVLRFSDIAHMKTPVDVLDLNYDVGFIQFTLVVGVFTEIAIALRERFP
jgi:hypothetical protein